MVRAAIDVGVARGTGCSTGRIDAGVVQAFAGAAVGGARAELAQRQADGVALLVDATIVRATVGWAGALFADTLASTKQIDGGDGDQPAA